jgi:hypothetical protein
MKLAFAILVCASCTTLEPSTADPDDLQAPPGTELAYASSSTWGSNVEPAAWDRVTDRVIYNRRGADNLWDAYSANADGTDERCVTCALPVLPGAGTATNRGASDISPDGKYLLVSIEKGVHPGTIGDPSTENGRGVYNDLWLVRSDGSAAYPLTNLPTSSTVGVIWPRFDRTGGSIVWSQMYGTSSFGSLLGQWKLQLADLVLAGTPKLTNLRTFEPATGKFFEPYGFSPDNQTIVFASDLDSASAFESKIWTTNRTFTSYRQIAPVDATGWFADYDEFAYFVPGTDRILFASTYQTTSGGMDWWTMGVDGSDVRRVTYFDTSFAAEGGASTILGGLAFDPQNPLHVLVGRTDTSSEQYAAVSIDLAEYGSQNGLAADYFSGTSLATSVVTRIDPNVELQWNGPPAPGVPATGDSIRWTGTLTPPQTGAYDLCLDTDDGGRVYVGGTLVIAAWWSGVGVHCATVSLTANRAVALQVEAWNGIGEGRAYLSWTRPDGVHQTVSPTVLRH